MKKRISLLLILTLLITSLVACKAPDKNVVTEDSSNGDMEDEQEDKNLDKDLDKDKNTTLTVQVEKEWKDYYEKAAKRVKSKYPNSNIEFIEKTTQDHLELLETKDLEDKEIADLFAISLDKLDNLEEKGSLGELETISIAENLKISKDYDKGLGGKFKVDEKYLAFPMNIKPLLNFINIKNAEENDIYTSKNIEFTELSNEDIHVPIFDMSYANPFINAGNIELLTEMETGEYYSDMTRDFSELSVAQEEIFKAIYNYWYYSQEEDSLLFVKEKSVDFMDSSFKTGGNTSIRTEYVSSKEHLSELAEENLEIFPIGKLVVMGNELSQWKDGDGLAINSRIESDEAKIEIANSMIEEIVNPKYAIEFFKETGKILANSNLEIYTESDLEDTDKDLISAAYKSYENAIDGPVLNEWGKMADTWEESILSWNTLNPKTVEEAYKILQDEFIEMINSIK